ncbi:electron transport complex subunit RsxC [Shewanella sp. HL-SH2]|uniref:electron transport complex subunit RsxC n=1 Tax=Shewanella sp. HL-SH2 TaxID=3436238 RepID=UPI003EBB9C6F
MLTLLEQLDKGSLWQSPGGIHPPELKHLSNQQPIARLPLAKQFIVPVPQVGDQARLIVELGQSVLKGQVLTEGSGFIYLPVHAPTSGMIMGIEPVASNHASGLPVMSCIIEADGLDTWCELAPSDILSVSNDEIIARIKQAGIAGMGGATFPTHIKLNTASKIDLVIINGIECEPYITSDDRLMRDYSNEILAGIEIIYRVIKPQRIIIAIEDNKPEAVEAMKVAISHSQLPPNSTRVTVIPTKYPSGGEKQLIQIITGKEVPSGCLPSQLGIVVQNVGTAFAIQDAVIHGKPLVERVVTLTGNNIHRPGNYWLPIGTPISTVLDQVNFSIEQNQKVIIGGPMMGYAIQNTNVPILKGTNCILAPSAAEIAPDSVEKACIRCGECAIACPALLLPQQLFWHAKAEEYDKAASFNLQDCIECGCCSYVCPSNIPLVEYYRIAKSALKIVAEEKVQADKAKVRFEARLQRLEDEKLAREAKAKDAAAKRQASMKTTDKDAVAAAMARIAAKKASATQDDNVMVTELTPNTQVSQQPSNDVNNTSDKKSAVSAAIQRAKAKKAAQVQNSDTPATDRVVLDSTHANNTEPVKAALSQQERAAAAVARAKAKKALQTQQAEIVSTEQANSDELNDLIADVAEQPHVSAQDADKQARVAAAIVKAKAKKLQSVVADNTIADQLDKSAELAASAEHQPILTEPTNDISQSPDELKKARVAAAIAKAKAKKMTSVALTEEAPVGKSTTNITLTKDSVAEHTVQDKQAKIAAAIAKAKAKKLAQQAEKED